MPIQQNHFQANLIWCDGTFKGTQAWDSFEFFFLPKSNPYMPFVNFRKKFRFSSFDFRQNFDVRTFPRWLSIRGTKFFLRDIQQNFSFKIFTLVLSDRFLDGFSKFWFFIGEICILIRDFWVNFENYRMRMLSMLSIRGTDFIACWTYEERISAHAQPAVKCLAYAERILSHTEHTGN